MTLTITGTTMTGDHTDCTARKAPGRKGWEVSWLPRQTLDANAAVTAMTLADIASREDLHEGHRLWPHIQGWAAELGLTGPEAVAAASQPPDSIHHDHENAGGCSATRWLGMSVSRWVGMTGDGKGPAGGVGGALWCPGCRGGGRVVVVSRWRGRWRW
jgi:hypothetical protein